MVRQSDRVKSWRQRQKAEGKMSVTVLLSDEAREILNREKEATGESYSVVVEKALKSLKKPGHRLPNQRHPHKEEKGDLPSLRNHQPPLPTQVKQENGTHQKILIDDLANYPSLKDIEMEQALKKTPALDDSRLSKGFINRLFRPSSNLLGHRKKWFQ
jgi:hypothetical protein